MTQCESDSNSNAAGSFSGIFMDKTMKDKLIYILNNDKQDYYFCRLKSFVEKFEHYYLWASQINSVKIPKDFVPTNKITGL